MLRFVPVCENVAISLALEQCDAVRPTILNCYSFGNLECFICRGVIGDEDLQRSVCLGQDRTDRLSDERLVLKTLDAIGDERTAGVVKITLMHDMNRGAHSRLAPAYQPFAPLKEYGIRSVSRGRRYLSGLP